jgi:hypothetical protein
MILAMEQNRYAWTATGEFSLEDSDLPNKGEVKEQSGSKGTYKRRPSLGVPTDVVEKL